MGQKCPENCKNCIKIVENARFSCKTPKIWRYFCAFLLLDNKCGKWYNWPAEHGGAGRNFVNYKSHQIFSQISVLFVHFSQFPKPEPHSRNPICSIPYCRPQAPVRTGIPANATICKISRDNSARRAHMLTSRNQLCRAIT